MRASILESGAVYYPAIFALPIVVGVVLALRKPGRRALWILAVAVGGFVLLDFALDETRSEDVPFFVVLGLFMFGLGLGARWVTRRATRGSA